MILPAEVPLPTAGVEYTPLSDEQSDQLIDSLTQSFYRHVSRCVSLLKIFLSLEDNVLGRLYERSLGGF